MIAYCVRPRALSICPVASPRGTTLPQAVDVKWWISVSMSVSVRSRGGGVVSGWSALIGPSGMLSRHWRMMRRDCRISCARTQVLSKQSPFVAVGTSNS